MTERGALTTLVTRALAWRWTRWIVGAVSLALLLALFLWLERKQQVRTFYDSTAYLEAARMPLSWEHLFHPKPPTVSLVYKLIGPNLSTIAAVQRGVCFASWALLGIALVAYLRRRSARIAAGVVIAFFIMAPVRVGYTDDILSESITDSLFALCVATLLALTMLRGKKQIVAAVAFGLLTIAWTFARDSNAIIVIVAAVFVACTMARTLWRTRWGVALVAITVVAAGVCLWSVDVPRTSKGFETFQSGWPADFRSRGTWSKLNNVFDRILPDPDARAYYREHGLVEVERLPTLEDRSAVVYQPDLASTRIWIEQKSRGVYLRWLLRHPGERVKDQVEFAWVFLGQDTQTWYMPKRWQGFTRSKLVHWVFDLTSNRVLIVALLLLLPFALWRSWRHAGRNLVLGLVVSGWIGSVAAFYADSAEYGRHCYGSGQQILFGLCLALLLLLDTGLRRGVSRAEPGS